jgi:hypothetical protein
MLSGSFVVYQKMSFGAWKGSGCYASRKSLLGAFTPSPLGSRPSPLDLLYSPWHGARMWHSGCMPMYP